MNMKNFKPGETVRASGAYRAEHDAHQLMHTVSLVQKSYFPRCRQCLTDVRFQLVRPASDLHILPFRSSAILEEFTEPTPLA